MTDLSKAIGCLSHAILIAKLDAFGFDKMSLKLVHKYLSNRKQSAKINDSYSSQTEILYGVPQGSILGPLLFNILYEMFYFLENYEIANYVDDTTPYSSQRNHQFVFEELEKYSAILFKWLGNNFMKVNIDKSHLLISGHTKLTSNMDITESEMKQELLGITIDSNLSFGEHVNNICKNANQKLNNLAQLSSYTDIQKRKVIMNHLLLRNLVISRQFGCSIAES